MLRGAERPFIRVTSLGSLMMVFANVPSTTYPCICKNFFFLYMTQVIKKDLINKIKGYN